MMSLGVLDEGTACLGCGMGDHTEDAILDFWIPRVLSHVRPLNLLNLLCKLALRRGTLLSGLSFRFFLVD